MRKSRGKYTTLPGVDVKPWRNVAEEMRNDGHQMNTATARNHFNRIMVKLAKPILEYYGIEATPQKLKEISESDDFQLLIYERYCDFIYGDNDE